MLLVPLARADSAAVSPPVLPVWNDGTNCVRQPDVESAWLGPDTAILRESLCHTAEAPFIYLLFGSRDALLIDSGDGTRGFAAAVGRLINEHAARRGRAIRRLIVAHTHAHSDHVQGDAALRRSGATVVGHDRASVAAFFRISSWPDGSGGIDLGERRIAVLPLPGHEPAHVAFHDPRTGFLLTGDTFYPGRLYVPRDQFRTYEQSVIRLRNFAAENDVHTLLGAHVEMSKAPGVDFPVGSRVHVEERPLPMARRDLEELVSVLAGLSGEPGHVKRNHFILFPVR